MLSRLRLRRQVIWTVTLLLAPLLAAMVWAGVTTWGERERELSGQSATVATTIAASLDQSLALLYGLGSTLARHESVIALDPTRSQRLFAAVLAEQPLLANLGLRRRDGVLVSTATSSQPQQLPALDYVADVYRTGKPVMSDVFNARVGGKPTAVLLFPVRDDRNEIVGAIGLQLALERLQSAFSGIPLPEGGVVTVTDRNGRILVRSVDADKYVGAVATLPGGSAAGVKDVDGTTRLAVDAALDRTPWHVMVGIPQSEALWRAAAMWKRNVSVVVVGLFVVVAIASMAAMRLSRHLEELQSAAQRIAGGDLDPPPTTRMPNLELDELQHAFVAMAAKLREARDAHERQVEQERHMNETLQSMQGQIVRQERLAAVGVLLSGVAHELNNPLQAILGTSELLERRDGLPADAREEIGLIQSQAARARNVVRSLARFTEAHAGITQPVSVRDVASEVVALRAHELRGGRVAIAVEASTTRLIEANAGEIGLVLLNLLLNAEQALLDAAVTAPEIRVRVLDAGENVRCEVSDNGPGVRPEDEPKLFQPFATTRAVAMRTGLGLSTSYGIVRSYGGTIGYHRNESGGASFFFELPAVRMEDDVQDRSALLQQSPHTIL